MTVGGMGFIPVRLLMMMMMEDEERAIFDCPEYNICRLKCPELQRTILMILKILMIKMLYIIFFGILEISLGY